MKSCKASMKSGCPNPPTRPTLLLVLFSCAAALAGAARADAVAEGLSRFSPVFRCTSSCAPSVWRKSSWLGTSIRFFFVRAWLFLFFTSRNVSSLATYVLTLTFILRAHPLWCIMYIR